MKVTESITGQVVIELKDGEVFRLRERDYTDSNRLEITAGQPAHELTIYPQMANVVQLVNAERALD